MTTSPVVSVTDELVAELEALASKSEIRDEQCMSGVTFGDIRAMLAERAELLRDAERYRWLRESMWYVGPDNFFCGEGGDMNDYENHNYRADTLDTAIDAAMQSESQEGVA